jgi:hypothetical protein
MLYEGAERRDAGAWTDHDDIPFAIFRQAEAGVGLDKDPHMRVQGKVGQIMRANAPAIGSFEIVVDLRDGQMYFIAVARQGLDAIEYMRGANGRNTAIRSVTSHAAGWRARRSGSCQVVSNW